jgi:hypothetical protein
MRHAARLVRFFPPAWRRRYGDEFVAMLGPQPLQPGQVFDVVMAAVDAWLSTDVRRAAGARLPAGGGGTMTFQSVWACTRNQSGVTPRDGLIGAVVMLGVNALFLVVGIIARRNGWPVAGETLKSLSFLVSFVVSMPFWLMKGQPWKAQAAVIGVTLALLASASYIASLI